MKKFTEETRQTVHTVLYRNKTYYKIQDIAEKKTARHRTHIVRSTLNVLSAGDIIDVVKAPHYKFKSAAYIEEQMLKHIVLKRESSIMQEKGKARKPEKWDVQSACWIRDILKIDVHISTIKEQSNRSSCTMNTNIRKAIRRHTDNILK